MAFPYFDQEQLEARIGATLVRRILDDDNDGNADSDAVDRLRRDASAKVASGLGPTHPRDELSALAEQSGIGEEIIRVALDFAEAYAAKRHPEVVRREWEPLMKFAMGELKSLRTTIDTLPTASGPTNEGARTSSGDPNDPDKCIKRFSDNWGDF